MELVVYTELAVSYYQPVLISSVGGSLVLPALVLYSRPPHATNENRLVD